MPKCPSCGTGFLGPLVRCPDCGAVLRTTPGRLPDSDTTTATVATFPTIAEADMVRELLQRNGIEATVAGEVDPLGTNLGTAPIELTVAAEDLERALELYDAYFQAEATVPED